MSDIRALRRNHGSASRGAHSLVIGLDGADLDVVLALGPERLPHLFELMRRGVHAALQSVLPPATLPNWTTFLTGLDPGQHGVFDFTTRRGYAVRFSAGSVREAPTFAARLDAIGKTCACLFFPATYPPERLQRGAFISGWDSPVAFEVDPSFVWPRSLYGEIRERFGVPRFDDVDEFDAEAEGWHARLPDALCARIARRVELARHLLTRQRWDLFAIYFGESDTAAHHLWSLWDERSPRHPRDTTPWLAHGLPRVYQALDNAVGELVEAAGGEDVEVTLVSDHGSGGASDKVLHLNRYLHEAGFLRLHPRRPASRLSARAKQLALTRLPPRLRERLFRAAGAALPGLLESRARFAAIDMTRTHAFSDELNYFPAIHYNLRGREPRGTVQAHERRVLRRSIEHALLALRDPDSGQPVVQAVHAREELFCGPFVERAPDLLLELALDNGYSYNLMPSASNPEGGVFRRLAPEEYLGRKGRSLPGSHRPRGLFVAAGPRVAERGAIDLRMAEATQHVLQRLGAASLIDARVEALAPPPRAAPGAAPPPVGPAGDEARVEARLRKLGYIE